MSTTEAEAARDALVERLFLASVGMAELLTVHLGDSLGLYAAIDNGLSMGANSIELPAGYGDISISMLRSYDTKVESTPCCAQ